MGKIKHIENIEGVEVPIHIYVERRKSVRVAFGRSAINLRVPTSLSQAMKEKHYKDAIAWVRKKAKAKPTVLNQYVKKDYDNQPTIQIYGEELNLQLNYADRKTGKADYISMSKTIVLEMPMHLESDDKDKMIKQLLSRICAQIFRQKIEDRVREINDKCFHKEIKSVNLKYNKSNWGSCSSAKNLNLSTRLLFAPQDVIDYVIIHELAHLYEMNHSAKFWNIVSQVMPDYKEKENWLSQNGKLCDF